MLNHEKDPRLSTAPARAGSCVAIDGKDKSFSWLRDRGGEPLSFLFSLVARLLTQARSFFSSTRLGLRGAGLKRTTNQFVLRGIRPGLLENLLDRHPRRAQILVIAFSFIALKAASATPQVVRVDGSIFDATGVPLSTNKDIQIQAYDAATGGSLLWTSAVYNTVIANGRFTVNMNAAAGTPTLSQRVGGVASSGAIWFEVHYDTGTAGNGTMDSDQTVRPRIRAKGTMFALSAAQADSMTGVTATAAEINQLVGVTANLSSVATALSGVTVTSVELNRLSGVTTSLAPIATALSGITGSVLGGYLNGLTANVQAQLNAAGGGGGSNPFGGRTECTTNNGGNAGNGGATLITGVAMPAFCIENTIRSSANQATATSTCSGLGGNWGLCRQQEVTSACWARFAASSTDSIAQSISSAYHWTADRRDASYGLLVGTIGCAYVYTNYLTNSNGFRCCLR